MDGASRGEAWRAAPAVVEGMGENRFEDSKLVKRRDSNRIVRRSAENLQDGESEIEGRGEYFISRIKSIDGERSSGREGGEIITREPLVLCERSGQESADFGYEKDKSVCKIRKIQDGELTNPSGFDRTRRLYMPSGHQVGLSTTTTAQGKPKIRNLSISGKVLPIQDNTIRAIFSTKNFFKNYENSIDTYTETGNPVHIIHRRHSDPGTNEARGRKECKDYYSTLNQLSIYNSREEVSFGSNASSNVLGIQDRYNKDEGLFTTIENKENQKRDNDSIKETNDHEEMGLVSRIIEFNLPSGATSINQPQVFTERNHYQQGREQLGDINGTNGRDQDRTHVVDNVYGEPQWKRNKGPTSGHQSQHYK